VRDVLGLRVRSVSLANVLRASFTVGVLEFFTKADLESGKYFVALNIPFAISSNAAALTFEAYSKLCGVGGWVLKTLSAGH
jgi:hypothetical protein